MKYLPTPYQANQTSGVPLARDPLAPSLEHLTEQFLNSQDIKSSSKATYLRGLRSFSSWVLERGEFNPTRETILAYKLHLEERRGSALTLSTYLTAVRRFFEWAEGMKYYPNVAKGIRGSRRLKGFRKEALTVPQARELCALRAVSPSGLEAGDGGSGIEELRDAAMVNLMVRTGLRTIEVIRADVGDLRQEGGEAVLWIQGKGRDAKDEFVLLTEETLKPLRKYLSSRNGTASEVKEPLFCSVSRRNANGRLTTRSIRRIVKARFKKMGLVSDRLTAHSLRHTAITLSLLGGATVQEAKVMARHASIDTTLIYAHNISRIQNAPERRVDDALSGGHV